MQVLAITISVTVTLVALALFAQAAGRIVAMVRLGRPAPDRFGSYGRRTATMLRETLGHPRMLQWSVVGAAHWFVFVGFGALFGTLVAAYGELFVAGWTLPLVGTWAPYGIFVELVALTTLLGILVLIAVRLANRPERVGRRSRFAGSTMWQGYYVEATIVVIAVLVLTLRALEAVHSGVEGFDLAHPVSSALVPVFAGLSPEAVRAGVLLCATVKIVVSMAWFIVLALNTTMGVAWHRFTAFPNIFFKRSADGATSLGPLPPVVHDGAPVDFEDPPEEATFGAGTVEDFTWKGLLDFSTCTECGRCQSQCPAWNTAKPLSPKLVITALRDHAHAKAPYLLAGGGTDAAGAERMPAEAYEKLPDLLRAEAERPLVGTAADGGVIDPDVLWSCTTCGACVEQCPVDIEHVDHIVDMRRYQVLIESAFPAELAGLFRNLENKGNPWGMNAADRLDWTTGLPFPVKVVGRDVPDLRATEWLFWVGCAGAFEDRAKRTTRAVAELLHLAEVEFAVLGDGETCTGDPARRAGNEFLFQLLAAQNVEALGPDGAGAAKVVVTCPHCFNTLGREYRQLGLELEVVHHTQLLDRLVRAGRLVPVQRVPEKVTYHDPCYLGRHNAVYTPPRELLGAVPGLELAEMPRTQERSFCCGAGGARMWMEERIGKRINLDRVDEALSLAPDTVAVACPFCRVMVSDGVTARQGEAADAAPAQTQVLDVAQMLLSSVRPEPSSAAAQPGPGTEDGRGM